MEITVTLEVLASSGRSHGWKEWIHRTGRGVFYQSLENVLSFLKRVCLPLER